MKHVTQFAPYIDRALRALSVAMVENGQVTLTDSEQARLLQLRSAEATAALNGDTAKARRAKSEYSSIINLFVLRIATEAVGKAENAFNDFEDPGHLIEVANALVAMTAAGLTEEQEEDLFEIFVH